MGQQELYDLLAKHPERWFSTVELVELLQLSDGSVNRSINKLLNRQDAVVRYRTGIGNYRPHFREVALNTLGNSFFHKKVVT